MALSSNEIEDNPTFRLAMNTVSRNEITASIMNRKIPLDTYHVYSDKIDEAKATNQKASGRCWIFAALNVMRLALIKRFNLEDFEFSQAYLFFFDKLEKANYFLQTVIDTLDEPIDGRVFQYLLSNPVIDGGQWDMIINLVEKVTSSIGFNLVRRCSKAFVSRKRA
jgi:bleomycin hydrolase